MRTIAYALACTAITTIIACSVTTTSPSPAPGKAGGSQLAPGADMLGHDCVAACGSADARKCTMPSSACTSNLCLVDPTQPIAHLAYCSIDCTHSDCPSGWHCEDVKAFENDSVTRACVANPAVCGDGIVELGEVCDGDGDGKKGHCVDCQKWVGVCGDGIVEDGEACDGDSKEGYCSADCKTLTRPSVTFLGASIDAYLAPDNVNSVLMTKSSTFTGILPNKGDAKGCGALDVVDANADAVRIAWTYCDANGHGTATITFSLPRAKTSYSTFKDIPDALKATMRVRDSKSGADVTLGPAEASFEFSFQGDASLWSSAVGPDHRGAGSAYFRFRVYRIESGKYDIASFRLDFSWVAPP